MANKYHNQRSAIQMIGLQDKLASRKRKKAGQKVLKGIRTKAKGAGKY